MRDAVELIDSDIRVPAQRHLAVMGKLQESVPWQTFADLDAALAFLDLYADYDEAGNLVSLERDAAHDSFPGDMIWTSLAAGAEAGNTITWRETYDGRVYRTVFDGRGGYRNRSSGRRSGEE